MTADRSIQAFFGFMHGEAVGWAVSPTIAAAYAALTVMLLCSLPSQIAQPELATPEADHE